RRRLPALRQGGDDRPVSGTRQFRKRAASLPPLGRQEHFGLRRTARPAARAEQHLLLRRLAAAAAEVPLLDRRDAVEYHRRFPAAEEWGIPGDADGLAYRGGARPC